MATLAHGWCGPAVKFVNLIFYKSDDGEIAIGYSGHDLNTPGCLNYRCN